MRNDKQGWIMKLPTGRFLDGIAVTILMLVTYLM